MEPEQGGAAGIPGGLMGMVRQYRHPQAMSHHESKCLGVGMGRYSKPRVMPRLDPYERFMRHVFKSETGCWEWTGYLDKRGYGYFNTGVNKVPMHAHRWLWIHLNGPVPEGWHVDHLCRRRSCVNPAHMEPVPAKVNTLRGDGPCARHARKTHCIRGHEFTPENTKIVKNGRACIACIELRKQQQRDRVCTVCGTTFKSTWDKKTCSPECRRIACRDRGRRAA